MLRRSALVLLMITLSFVFRATAAEPAKTRTVEARDIKLTVPASWEQKSSTNEMRVAQFKVPKADGDADDGEFVVFFFGGDTGGVNANAQRWINQFHPEDRKVKMTSGKSPQGEYVVVDVTGTWKKPIGPPIRQKTVDMPNARVISIVLSPKDQGNYFLRLTGPAKTTSANAEALRAAIGAAAKSEKEYKAPAE